MTYVFIFINILVKRGTPFKNETPIVAWGIYKKKTGRKRNRQNRQVCMLLTTLNEPVHEISNNVVCATSKASDQPAHTRSLIRAFACRLTIL